MEARRTIEYWSTGPVVWLETQRWRETRWISQTFIPPRRRGRLVCPTSAAHRFRVRPTHRRKAWLEAEAQFWRQRQAQFWQQIEATI
jgi:hypothetical protein